MNLACKTVETWDLELQKTRYDNDDEGCSWASMYGIMRCPIPEA